MPRRGGLLVPELDSLSTCQVTTELRKASHSYLIRLPVHLSKETWLKYMRVRAKVV